MRGLKVLKRVTGGQGGGGRMDTGHGSMLISKTIHQLDHTEANRTVDLISKVGSCNMRGYALYCTAHHTVALIQPTHALKCHK